MRSRQHQSILMYAVVGILATTVLMGLAPLAYSQNDQQGQNQGYGGAGGQGGDQSDQGYGGGNQGGGGQSYYGQGYGGGGGNQGGGGQGNNQNEASQIRNIPLEREIANRLRQEGYGTRGEIMILATGNQVILLGDVPNQNVKNGVANIARQASSGASIDNRLHVRAQGRAMTNAELEKDTYNNLSGSISRDVQVQAQNGTVTLSGHLNNWHQVADAIDAAFGAGATRVNSQFTVTGAGATAQGGAAGGSQAYGYAPGFQGQSGGMGGQSAMGGGAAGGMTRASSSDLRLARQVASQLRQQLPSGQSVQLVQPQSIYVTAQRGTVILHGYIQNSNEKQQAQQIAQSIPGVQNVRNDLTILSTGGGGGQASQGMGGAGGQNYGGATGGSQGFGGQGSQGYGGMSGQGGSYQPQGYIPPGQSQQGMSGQGQVGQSSGQQGFGGTAGQSQSGQAGAAGGQQGMTGEQQSMGGGQTAMSPADIALAQRVAQQLKQHLTSVQNIQAMRPGTIYVMAAQGNVMLHGFITNQNVKQQASQIANAIPGVRGVENTLRITGGTGVYPSYGYIPGQEGQQGAAGQGQGTQGSAQMLHIADQGFSGQNQGMTGQNQGIYGQNQGIYGQNQGQETYGQAPGQGMYGQPQGQGMYGQPQGQGMYGQPQGQGMYGQPQGQGMYGQPQGQGMYGQAPGQGTQGQGMYGQPQGQGMYGQGQDMSGQDQGMQPSARTQLVEDPSSSTSTTQTDMALAQQVAQKLRQRLTGQNVQVFQPGTLYVRAHNGTITLDGYVTNNAAKKEASQIAKSVSGVRNIKDQLSISSATAGGQALGYMPPNEGQSANQQFGNQMPGNQQYGNQRMGNQQMGTQSGGQMEDQSGSDQSDSGGM